MNNEMDEQLKVLMRAVAELAEASKRALGFVETRRYRDIDFNIGRRFVVADLSPLAFFHLVEHIESGDIDGAVHRLHDRLFPLLFCRHDWTELKRRSDERVQLLGKSGPGSYICKLCTAYALGVDRPLVGRGNLA